MVFGLWNSCRTDHNSKDMNKIEDSPKTHDVAAIILAAGRSQRMGAFKPLLPFGPTTIVESSIANMRLGGIENIVVVVGVGARAEELQAHLIDSNVSFAINPDPDSEMSASIACAVRVLPKEICAVVINPVDHAAVPAEVVVAVLYEWQHGARLVKPTWNERGGHPVLVDLKFRDALLSLDPNNGLKGLFSEHRDQVKRIPVNSKYIARDMDTWDDYAALHREVFGDAAPELPRKRD